MKSFQVQGDDVVEVDQPVVTLSRLTLAPGVGENPHRYGRVRTHKYGQTVEYPFACDRYCLRGITTQYCPNHAGPLARFEAMLKGGAH